MKDRYVADGNELSKVDFEDTYYSPTVNMISVMTLINLAAIEGKSLRAYDIKGAYLVPDVNSTEYPIYIRMDR